jgi:DNA processing protein
MGEELTGRGRGGGILGWVTLQRVPNIGPAAMLRLARVFGSPEAALETPPEDLITRGRISARQASDILALRGSAPALRREVAAWRAQGIGMTAIGEDGYPGGLADLRSPPPLLYVRGALRPEDARAVAIVGTRSPDRRGTALARRLGYEFAKRGFAIVSGLARGIDTAAHRGALRAEQGRTIAVLGCGLLRVYPPENALLARSIASRGCLVAEVPPDAEVETKLLLMRDRIQAALSRAVIVVQAHGECGSIVTARHAVRCDRLLYGVPWDEPPFSEGWRTLRSLGARPITSDSDLEVVAREIDAHEAKPKQRPLL